MSSSPIITSPKDELPDCIVVDPRLGGYPVPAPGRRGRRPQAGARPARRNAAPTRVELPLALRPYVDVVALGTVADVVPLLDENRALVTMGLGRLRSAPRPGWRALLEVSGSRRPTSRPRLSASGSRRASTPPGVSTTPRSPSSYSAHRPPRRRWPLALKLDELNAPPQDIEAAMVAEAAGSGPDHRRRRSC